jgi:polysaccharide export outer membrane protein
LLVGCLLGGNVYAQVPPAGHTPSTSPDAEPYRVGAGDALRLDVQGRADLSGTFTVADDGTIVFPLIGSVQAEGRTLAEMRSDLSRRISLFDRSSPQVSLSISDYKSRKIFVLGAVLLPGIYAFAELPNIWDAIAEAGGPLEDADLSKVELIPGDSSGGRTTTVVDVAAVIRQSRASSLPRLRSGDTVRVPRGGAAAMGNVLLFGAVPRPGSLSAEQAPDLVTAILKSGGALPEAKLKEIQIVRQVGDRSVQFQVNLNNYFKYGDKASNPILQAGDAVYLPREAPPSTGAQRYLALAGLVVGLTISILAISNNNNH